MVIIVMVMVINGNSNNDILLLIIIIIVIIIITIIMMMKKRMRRRMSTVAPGKEWLRDVESIGIPTYQGLATRSSHGTIVAGTIFVESHKSNSRQEGPWNQRKFWKRRWLQRSR